MNPDEPDTHCYQSDTDGQAQLTNDSDDPTAPETKTTRDCLWDSAATVLDWLTDEVDGQEYIKASDIAAETDLSTQQCGTALGHLAEGRPAELGVAVEQWGETQYGVTWSVEPVEVATDGGTRACPDCGEVGEPHPRMDLIRCETADCLFTYYQPEQPKIVADGGGVQDTIDNEFDDADRDAGHPATRLGQAGKQIEIASQRIDDPAAVAELAEALEIINRIGRQVGGD